MVAGNCVRGLAADVTETGLGVMLTGYRLDLYITEAGVVAGEVRW